MKESNTSSNRSRNSKTEKVNVRYLAVTAMLSAIAFILMFLDFPIPFLIPSFIQMDVSELPALVGAFALGPACGVMVCLVKNLLHLLITSTGGIGELSNFLLGAAFVLPAGLLYRRKKGRKSALLGAVTGAVIMAVVSVATNYFIVYPVYYALLPEDKMLAVYQSIVPSMNSILECLLCFNMPFTFVKGLLVTGITFLLYKHISPLLKG